MKLGRYELLDEVARGAMGAVYRARDASLQREVAIKILIGGSQADERTRKRFAREAELLAALRHPHVVHVHEAGADPQGNPYLVMELVQGRSLEERIEEGGALPPREAAALVRDAARGVHHAHERGILHRDLKPANVLLTPAGQALVTDFGLGKDLQSEAERLTKTGHMLGTPAFMPPEQADAQRGPADARADVYSLGATLYAALSGVPPYPEDAVHLVLARILSPHPPPAPSTLGPVDPALERVCMQALEKDPARRYPSAAALADDLDLWLAGRPVTASQSAVRAAQVRRAAPWLAGAAALLASALVLAWALRAPPPAVTTPAPPPGSAAGDPPADPPADPTPAPAPPLAVWPEGVEAARYELTYLLWDSRWPDQDRIDATWILDLRATGGDAEEARLEGRITTLRVRVSESGIPLGSFDSDRAEQTCTPTMAAQLARLVEAPFTLRLRRVSGEVVGLRGLPPLTVEAVDDPLIRSGVEAALSSMSSEAFARYLTTVLRVLPEDEETRPGDAYTLRTPVWFLVGTAFLTTRAFRWEGARLLARNQPGHKVLRAYVDPQGEPQVSLDLTQEADLDRRGLARCELRVAWVRDTGPDGSGRVDYALRRLE